MQAGTDRAANSTARAMKQARDGGSVPMARSVLLAARTVPHDVDLEARRPLQRLKPNVMMYMKMKLLEKIREGGSIARKAMHALIYREVRVKDPAREGRKCWFYANGTTLRFGSSEFTLVSGLRFGLSSFDLNAAHPIPPIDIFYRLFERKKTTMLMHFITLIPRVRRAMGGDKDEAYHWYGPVWIVQTWACEVFPKLGRQLGVVGGQLTTPRWLKWSFSSRSVDFSRFFNGQLDIQLMMPSAEELLRPYFQSLEGESVLGARYVAPRAPSKKKLLTDVACRVILRTCTRLSDIGVGERASDEDHLSDPRASRIKSPRRTEEESSREPEIPGRRPGEWFDSWFDRFVHVVAGVVEDRVMRRVGQMLDTFSMRIENKIVARLRRSPTPPPRGPTPHPRGPTLLRSPTPAPRGPTPPPPPLKEPTPLPRSPTPPPYPPPQIGHDPSYDPPYERGQS
ncbi:hypothetical protein C2S51_028311 [Perilla frutescens var. frutescens]|nr:hypothetical protein C2S51_028311 [Perilla frutescens var. frutescens]